MPLRNRPEGPLHVATHLVPYAALVAHVVLVLRRRLRPRMLPVAGAPRQDAAHG